MWFGWKKNLTKKQKLIFLIVDFLSFFLSFFPYVFFPLIPVLRMGRCVDTLYAAMRMIQHEDFLIRFDCGLSKVSFAGFLLCDHIVWLGRNRFAAVEVDWWTRSSYRFWLLSIVLNLVRDYVEIKRRLSTHKVLHAYKESPRTLLRNLTDFAEKHKDVVIDTVKNGCDIFIPLAALDHINLSPITIGLLGVISSAVGIYGVVDPFAKLPLT